MRGDGEVLGGPHMKRECRIASHRVACEPLTTRRYRRFRDPHISKESSRYETVRNATTIHSLPNTFAMTGGSASDGRQQRGINHLQRTAPLWYTYVHSHRCTPDRGSPHKENFL